jgi:hypothetical protein
MGVVKKLIEKKFEQRLQFSIDNELGKSSGSTVIKGCKPSQ